MKLRGKRECNSCGARWSYYETGEITCPECGSIRSVGLDDPTTHTAGTRELDLTGVRAAVDDVPLQTLADRAAEESRRYLREVGFVHAGELEPLDDTVLAASELRRVGATLGRVMQVSDEESLYFFELLQGADQNERPPPDAVPETLFPERGLAVAATVDSYTTDIRRVFEERERAVDRALSSVTAHRKRIEALDGDVPPAEAERLVRALRDLSEYLRTGEETALARVGDRL